ncbi:MULTISPECIES: NACHT domain-containing NTPase [unclassified Streptomyces]|uniref:NACHT domain-containing protein n=1 Tax=unclassified Streptomyces TaxID=2593676 RepID=UPI00278BE6BB|nr:MULTISPECIES: NACHT domain-containing protein [unclassified Streptomyces]
MELGTVGLKVASSVVKPLLERFVLPPKKAPGAEYPGEKPVRVRSLLAFVGDRPALSRDDMHRLSLELVRRAVRASDSSFEGTLSDDEQIAVGHALTETLSALGDFDMNDIDVLLLGPEALADKLRKAAERHIKGLLTPEAADFYNGLLVTACTHLVRIFTERPGFAARAQLSIAGQLNEHTALLEQLLRIVSGEEHLAADIRFEEDYSRYVIDRHRRITIYGVDLRDPGGLEWPLETAYLGQRAIAAPVSGATDTSEESGGEPEAGVEERVEDALATHSRVLLHGLAGTGKTTLVQWLAVTTARQDTVPGHLPQLVGRVPFVLPLRNLAREGGKLPMPQDFLRWMRCPLVGTEPDGWAPRVLKNGRGVVLIDGLDEIPEDDRNRTREWLVGLLRTLPGNLWLATTRPAALGPDWLRGEDFHECTLDALRPAELRHFIRRWHEAVGARAGLDDELTQALRANHGLSRLATNPLMCSLICALHRERRGFLPRGRAALYKAALSMLLERRDTQKELYERGPLLDEEAATEPLKRLAYWLIRNERAQIERSVAVDVVRRLQSQVPGLDAFGKAEGALQYLLERSGLLREPSVGAIDFIHRTFQDYLGAKAVLEERDFGMLVKHAHLDQWEDVVQMAVAQGDHRERAELLRQLSDRGNREHDTTVRARIRLLALASLEQATRLEPTVRQTIEAEAARMLPPRSLRQAKDLARTGPLLLGLLPRAEDLHGDEELATVHALCQIGGDAAIPRLREFLGTTQPAVRGQLLGHWDRFDTDVYAEEIIRPLLAEPRGDTVTVRSPAELAVLAELPGCERVGIHGDFDPAAVRAALDPEVLRGLRLRGALRVSDLALLDGFDALEELTLQSCRNLTESAPLTRLPRLRGLTLADLPQFEPLSGLAGCRGLEALHLGPGVPWRGLAELPYLDRLHTLALPPGAIDLSATTRCTRLRELRLHEAGDKLLPEDWGRPLAEVAELRTLTLSPEQLSLLLFDAQVRMPQVTHLYVYAKPGKPVPLGRIALRLPGLVELHLIQVDDIDLSHLNPLAALRRVRLAYPGNVRAAEELRDGVELEMYPRS